MAIATATATFTGSGNTASVSWSGVGNKYVISHSVQPNAGFGPVAVWYTLRSSSSVTVNIGDGTWQGKVVLRVADAPSVAAWSTLTTAQYPLLIPSTTFAPAGPFVTTAPFWIPADAGPVTIKVSNRYRNGGGGGVGNSVTSSFAVYTSDGTEHPTGTALATYLTQTVPGDGTEISLGPFTPVRGSDGKIVLVYSLPITTPIAISNAEPYGLFADGAATVSPPPAFGSGSPYGFLYVAPSFLTSRRKIAIIGDSIAGGSSGPGPSGSAWVLIGPHKDVVIELASAGGSNLGHWAQSATYPELWTDLNISGNDVYIQNGVNSLPAGLSQMQTDLTTLVNYLKAHGAVKIYSQTIAPQSVWVGVESTRTSWNTWIKANSLGLDGIVDLDLVLRDPASPTNLLAAYDAGDHLHWSAAGHLAAQPAIEAVVTP